MIIACNDYSKTKDLGGNFENFDDLPVVLEDAKEAYVGLRRLGFLQSNIFNCIDPAKKDLELRLSGMIDPNGKITKP